MKRKSLRQRMAAGFVLQAVMAAMFFCSMDCPVFANPSGALVTSGDGSVSQNGNTMTIVQRTDKLGIDWQSFSIGTGEKVQFIQPGSNSIALNRVIGSEPSAIFGSLSANGRIFLINPNGILFAPGAEVNVGSLVASTLTISDSDFNAGKYTFGGSGGSVVNQGNIAANSGYVALIGAQIKNEGIIIAKQGTVALGAGSRITLDMNGDGLLNLAVDQSAINASVANRSLIQADGGTVIMKASTKDSLLPTVVNSGVIRAQSVNNQNGIIRLEGGAVSNSGTLDVSGKTAGQTGGTVKVLGSTVTLAAGTNIDASGYAGGGTVLVGGDFQGKGAEQRADFTTVEAGVNISADALASGDGGKAVIWANGTTVFQGKISANGGRESGNGGQAEVSGKKKLRYQGTVDLRAVQGKNGMLLLDPTNWTVAGSGGDQTGAALSAALGLADITLLADDSILIQDTITSSSGHSLTLNAGNSVVFDGGSSLTTHGDINVISDGYVQIGNSGMGATIDAGGGNIKLLGVSAGSSMGIEISQPSKLITTGSGTIILAGTGALSGGVSISGLLQTGDGDISITGSSQAYGNSHYGVVISQGVIKSTGNGQITVTGAGGPGANTNYGIFLDNGKIQAANGGITLMGSSLGSGGSSNHGILLKNSSEVESVGAGTVHLTGISGQGTDDNFGIQVDNSKISSAGGNVILNGTSQGTGTNAIGVVLGGAGAIIQTTGNAQISITGQGSLTGQHNSNGVWLLDNSQIQSVDGLIHLTGKGGSGTNGNGLYLELGRITSSGNGDVLVQTTGDLRLGSGSQILLASGKAELASAGGHFINYGGAGSISAGGCWLIYTAGPSGNITGGLVNDFTQYGANYGDTVLGSGNGFVYSDNLYLTATLSGTVSKTYDGTQSAALSSGNFQLSGAAGLNATFGGSTGTYDNKNAGSGKTVTAAVNLTGVNDSSGKPVYGYTVNATASDTIGIIDKAALTITAAANTKTYDGTAAAAAVPAVSGLKSGDTVTNLSEAYINADAGTGKTLTVTGYLLQDGNGGGNYNVTTVDNTHGVIAASGASGILPAVSASEHYKGAVVTADDRGFKAKIHNPGEKLPPVSKQGMILSIIFPETVFKLSSDGWINVFLPREILNCAGEAGQLTATLADGRPLPYWLNFDPRALRFFGQLPNDISGVIHLRLAAKNIEGNQVSYVFTLSLGALNKNGNSAIGS